MKLPKPIQSLRAIYEDYPPQFWLLIVGVFIDNVGAALVFPFLTLYATRTFDVGMLQVGVLMGIFSVTNLAGNTLGGALADRFGRKGTLLLGIIASAVTSLLMGWARSFFVLGLSMVVAGLFANVAGPAAQALLADLLPPQKRSQGFGILRVVANLAVAIGPAIGGILAIRSYFYLFVGDMATSLVTAGLVYVFLKETLPPRASGAAPESLFETFRGYKVALRDRAFMAFSLASMLVMVAAMQLNTTLSVYLRDVHGITQRQWGLVLTLNATMVVLFQFSVTRRMRETPPLLTLALGSALYAIGYALYGAVSGYALFLGAMAVVTTGEMLFAPSAQAVAADMSPEHMRGRYLAAFGLSRVVPGVVGPIAIGWVMDNLDPRWTWFVVGLAAAAAAAAFLVLDKRLRHRLATIRWRERRSAEGLTAPARSSDAAGYSPPA
jgi:MFS family permease